MDIISYGVAAQVARAEKKMRETTLAVGVEGTHPHARSRVDTLERAYQGITDRANQLAVQDAVNIVKAHAKLNVVAKSTKYKMHQMIFEDFLSATGIDSTKSSGYTVDTTNGLVKASGIGNYTMVATQELADTVPKKAILVVEESNSDLTIPGGNATSSSNYSGSNTAASAFNNLDDQYGWIAATGSTTGWLSYDFGIPTLITRYTLKCNNASTGIQRAPKDWTFEGWNGSDWIILDQQSNVSDWKLGTPQILDFKNTVAYMKYRINVSANNGDASYLSIGEMELINLGSILGVYSISRDDGITWEPIIPEELFYFKDSISPVNTKLRLKAELPSNVQLLNYGLTWV